MPVDVLAEVVTNTHLSRDYNVLGFDAPEIAGAVRPGQFVMLRTTDTLEPLLRRPFSVFEILRDAHGVPTGFTVLSKRVGIGTTRLYDTRPGDRIACLGPLGQPFTVVSPPSEAWLVAGGVGLAPFATLVEALRARGTRTTLFYGARTSAELHCLDTFVRAGLEVVTTTEDGTHGVRGLVTAPLADRLAQAPPDRDVHLFACGPTPMMRAVARLAATASRPCAVSLEQVMGCGMGGCYSCVVRVRQPDGSLHFVRSCVEGPVFDCTTIVWEEMQALAHT